MKEGVEVKKSIEDVSPVVKRLKVEIPREVVEKKREESFLKIQKTAKIQGFRPGKAPLSIIKTRFRARVIEQLEEDLIKEGYFEAAKEAEFRAVAIREIEDGKYIDGEAFRFTALVEVVPEFEPVGYGDIDISDINHAVTDEEVMEEIERMRETQAVYRPVDRESGEGDLLEVDFKAFDGEELVEEKENSTYLLSGTGALGEEFDGNLMGKKAGDAPEFEITYPDDFSIDQIKGKKILYKIGVRAVKEKVLPDLDDEFARSLPEIESLDDLKGRIREHLEGQKLQAEKRRQHEELLEALVEKNPVEVPQTLVDEEINRMISDTHKRLEAQGVKFDPSQMDMRNLRERYRENAVKSVRSSLILAEIAKKEGIEATEEDVNRELKTMSENFNISFEKVSSYYSDERTRGSLKNSILEAKVLEFLLKSGDSDAEKKGKGKSTGAAGKKEDR